MLLLKLLGHHFEWTTSLLVSVDEGESAAGSTWIWFHLVLDACYMLMQLNLMQRASPYHRAKEIGVEFDDESVQKVIIASMYGKKCIYWK